ncbi:hypothetical protein E2C01_034355 [Portunus trituberculatus]|uniref:Uncharacterized protein n=1 Tax=Portunus trituberculatus TaxID=210409 RepID=A0A5B7F5I4_PORTR|nr:hypothetical protein [Portunus trituberculatus]
MADSVHLQMPEALRMTGFFADMKHTTLVQIIAKARDGSFPSTENCLASRQEHRCGKKTPKCPT